MSRYSPPSYRGSESPIVVGLPAKPAAVGGCESPHPGGVQIVLSDSCLRLIGDTISMRVHQWFGWRADGPLLSKEF